jgi:serine/threonine protein kinase
MPTDKIAGSLVGQTIGGRYRLTKLLGEGGMGEVYAADHIHITKKVAVKLLHREISTDEQAIARFKQEAQSASSIGHDNIVRIDDFFELDDGRVCMCMEYLAGENLANVIHAVGADQPARGIEIMRQVCEGLSAAHALGIVHRDMKPENVFLTRLPDGSERAKLLDFGIAKVVGGEASNLTKTGTVFGTPHYMSPEQALGQTIDPRADIYSLGVMLYEMFAGEVPFKAETFMGVLSQHITEQPAQPSTVTPGRVVPAQIERVILKAMAKKAEDRFSSAAALKEALLAAASDLGWHVSVPTDLPAPTRRGVVSPTGEPAGGPSQPSALQTGSAAANRASAPLTGPASAGRPSAVLKPVLPLPLQRRRLAGRRRWRPWKCRS